MIGRRERDRRFGGTSAWKENTGNEDIATLERQTRIMELTFAVKETRSCHKCDKVGHLATDLPDIFESRKLEFNARRFPTGYKKWTDNAGGAAEFTPVISRLEFGNKSKESRTSILEPRVKRYGDVEKNGEVNALQIGMNQKLHSGEYTGIGGLVKINNRHLTWQLDTGAGFNVISEQLAKELGFVGVNFCEWNQECLAVYQVCSFRILRPEG
ncbi:hypothetical protein AYI69_g4359 [Smittium culicis]|uniref:Uncharacterized protein n=1 Tax=Smittium culicis TaxID=133412 RepID=A0A1R1YF00_9FUNG|nr:hypothetical protein AYI69_g4359 [Smittium culicis]